MLKHEDYRGHWQNLEKENGARRARLTESLEWKGLAEAKAYDGRTHQVALVNPVPIVVLISLPGHPPRRCYKAGRRCRCGLECI